MESSAAVCYIYLDVVHEIRPIISQLIDISINLQSRGGHVPQCPIAGDATAARTYASCIYVVHGHHVCPSVRLSVCHTRELSQRLFSQPSNSVIVLVVRNR